MSEEQLTVAELLARSGKSSSGSGSRRRRRRSLEEGGISVAEFTGSIPRVTEKPEDARHTTSPIDSTADKAEQEPRQEATKPAATKPATPKVTQPEAAKPQVKQPEATKPKRESRDDDTMVLRVFTDGESAPLTTGSFLAVPQQTAQKSESHTPTQEADATSVLPKVVVEDEDEPADIAEEDDFFPEDDEDIEGFDDTDDAYYDDEVAEEDEKPSIASIVVTAIVAFIIGVLVFYAFMSLWASSLMPLIVIVAALVVTVAIGVAVHSLKTGKDTLTTVLATVTGLVLTFGPALITGL